MKTLFTALLGLTLSATAQTLTFDFDALAAKAKEKAEIKLDGAMLKMALEKSSGKAKEAAANVSSLTVHHYEFAKSGEYSDADLETIRKQATSSAGWSRIISTKEEHESVDIFVQNQGGKASGFLLIAAEAKELTVVHIVGTIDLASLQEVVASTIKYDLSSVPGQ